MFKSLYGLSGELTASISEFAATMSIDDELMGKLRMSLKGFDYTYLIVKTAATYEIIRTNGFVANTVGILRGRDGTVGQAFDAGTTVEFVMGDEAIADMINDRMLGQLVLTGSGIITVTKTSDNSYSIYAPPVNITSDSDKVLVGGEFPNYVLSAPLVSGCCD